MGSDWGLYIFIFVIGTILMSRLDRLGKQIEAVCVSIRADVARTEDDRNEILGDWNQAKKDASREKRQFWIVWAIIAAAALAWALSPHW
jgi:hypothetical protein